MTHEAADDGTLVGRADELIVLNAFLRSATLSGGVLLVAGDAGLGKSALLRTGVRAAEAEAKARVLRAAGVEFEADLGYACLNQLLLPVVDELADVPEAHTAAIRAAMGVEAGDPPELLQLTAAVLGLLRRLRRERPLLLVVDDLQWVDRSTLLLLSLLARRLDGSGVALLLAQRSGHETPFDRELVPTLELSALSAADGEKLLLRHHPQLHHAVRQRIVADAEGNPLALIELPRGLTAAQEAAADVLPPTLPLSMRLRRLFASRIAVLPPASRRLLLLAALHYGDDVDLMRIVAGSSRDLGPAETAGLVLVDPRTRQLRFTHPLVRAAVVDLASAPERRTAHRRLSQLTAVAHIRALHLAESVLGTDDRVAAMLDDVADAALARGDPGRAVGVLLRAAELTSAAPDRARRLAAAAYLGANVTGTLTAAPALLAQARSADPDAINTLQVATAAAAHLLNSDRGVDTPHQMLVRALAALPVTGADSRVVQEAVRTLMLVCAFGGRADLWAAFQQAVAAAAPYLTPALRLTAISLADPAHVTAQQLAELDELVTSTNDSTDPVRVLEVAAAGHYVDREPTTAMDRVARAGRNGGPVPLAAQAQVMLAMTAFHEGRWAEATSRAEEGVALCVEHGYQLLEWGMLNPLMLVAAARGDSAYLAGVRDRLRQWPVPRQMMAARGFTGNVDGLEALSMARYADAYAAYSSVAEPGALPAYSQAVLWNVLEVVEAALGSGHVEEARAHAAVAAASLASISPRLRFHAVAAAALIAPNAGYRAAFDRVVNDPAAVRWPFHLARTELAYGERLRRDRAARLARPHLERAIELFTALEATPWIDRAAAALGATGKTRHPSSPDDRTRLTSQELQVAQLAASGLTNREIADRMHLSPRTVGAHLYRAFPKLGVGTRAGLRDALSQYAE